MIWPKRRFLGFLQVIETCKCLLFRAMLKIAFYFPAHCFIWAVKVLSAHPVSALRTTAVSHHRNRAVLISKGVKYSVMPCCLEKLDIVHGPCSIYLPLLGFFFLLLCSEWNLSPGTLLAFLTLLIVLRLQSCSWTGQTCLLKLPSFSYIYCYT